MKWFSALIVSLAMFGGVAQAAGPDDQYLNIYTLIQQADELSKDPQLAVEKYTQAKAGLLKMQSAYPTWNTDVIKFRLEYVTDKLNDANKRLGATAAPVAPVAPKKATPADLQQQITDLAEQVRGLAAEKSTLEKRLKEALSVQPASTDPLELAKAQKEIEALKKERDLLRLSIEDSKANPTDSSSKKAQAKEAKWIKERDALKAELEQFSKNIEQLKSQLAQASSGNKGLKALQEKLDDADKDKAKLAKEIAALKKKLSEKEAKRAARGASSKEVEQLKARLNVYEAAPVAYTPEELAVIQKAPVKPEIVPVPAAKADAAPVPTAEPVAAAAATATNATPATNAVASTKRIRSSKDLPPGTSALMADAQRSFMSRDYEGAEKKFSDLLGQDENNVYIMSHLASAQFFANHSEACEKTLDKALSIDPDDALCLYTKGNLRLRQNKLDDAVEALTHSAAINPANSAVQNSLGLVLSQKGMTKPAETALRKALQMDPDFPEAHQNLAVVYATQKPPFMELARWHYKKSILLGQPKNPELEKLLDAAPAPAAPSTNAPAK